MHPWPSGWEVRRPFQCRRPSIAIIDSRAATACGEQVPIELTDGDVADRALTVVSRVAQGIDGVAPSGNPRPVRGDDSCLAGVGHLYAAGRDILL